MPSFTALTAGLALASSVLAGPTETTKLKPRQVQLPPVTATGNAFFANGQRFFVRGIAYQPGGASANIDPLADASICLPDVQKFKDLGVNVIRVYSTDNSLPHDECMNALAEAGIYVALDANNPLYSINRDNPGPSYNTAYLQSVFATIDAFAKYTNTFAFYSGNEVVHDKLENTLAARYVKATTRDMRNYIRQRGYRPIPVGYSAADVSQNRMQTAAYFNCGTDDERSDFFAFNDYSWCNSNFQVAGWGEKVQNFTGYGIPIFLSEYGCTTNGRDFGEVEALMSPAMTGVYSGGLMYEYTMEENGFGIVQLGSKDGTGPRSELPEFANYKSALAANPAPTGASFQSTSNSVPCPTRDANWMVDSTLLPAIPSGALAFMQSGAGTGPGLNGPGSQNAGGTSTGDAAPGSGSSTGSPNAGGLTHGGPIEKMPFIVAGLAIFFTATGALLL